MLVTSYVGKKFENIDISGSHPHQCCPLFVCINQVYYTENRPKNICKNVPLDLALKRRREWKISGLSIILKGFFVEKTAWNSFPDLKFWSKECLRFLVISQLLRSKEIIWEAKRVIPEHWISTSKFVLLTYIFAYEKSS